MSGFLGYLGTVSEDYIGMSNLNHQPSSIFQR